MNAIIPSFFRCLQTTSLTLWNIDGLASVYSLHYLILFLEALIAFTADTVVNRRRRSALALHHGINIA